VRDARAAGGAGVDAARLLHPALSRARRGPGLRWLLRARWSPARRRFGGAPDPPTSSRRKAPHGLGRASGAGPGGEVDGSKLGWAAAYARLRRVRRFGSASSARDRARRRKPGRSRAALGGVERDPREAPVDEAERPRRRGHRHPRDGAGPSRRAARR
jgi:hypothetical protein